jgi:hypothetical protein
VSNSGAERSTGNPKRETEKILNQVILLMTAKSCKTTAPEFMPSTAGVNLAEASLASLTARPATGALATSA